MTRLIILMTFLASAVVVSAQDMTTMPIESADSISTAPAADHHLYPLGRWQFRYQDQLFGREQYVDFLEYSCPEAYVRYWSGQNLYRTGWGVFGGALGTGLASGICLGLALAYETPSLIYTSIALSAASGALLIGSMVCIGAGALRRASALDVYNGYCAPRQNTAAATLQMGVMSTGHLGLTIYF